MEGRVDSTAGSSSCGRTASSAASYKMSGYHANATDESSDAGKSALGSLCVMSLSDETSRRDRRTGFIAVLQLHSSSVTRGHLPWH